MNDLLERAEVLQNMLVSQSTGGSEDDSEYRQLREVFTSDPTLEKLLPKFVRTCRSLFQFWEYIKHEFSAYADRRAFIWDAFRPLIDHLEKTSLQPSDGTVTAVLENFDPTHVHSLWSKALDRRQSDPEGAITLARTLLETVCKHILEDMGVPYSEKDELPKLYKITAESLNLAPSQHTEEVFRQILGGCSAVVEGLGALRNRLSDAHGKGPKPVKPAPRHAELAVNLSGAMSTYLVSTWKSRKEIEA